MADENKYYWLKLKRDFFKRHDIRIIEELPNGKDYVLFYLKMLLESIDHGGELRFNETIPYNDQMLSIITNTNIDLVRSALKMLIQLKMIEVLDDETIYMIEVEKMTGKESASAERVRKHRELKEERIVLLQSNNDVTKCNTEIEKEIDIDRERDKKSRESAAAPSPSGKKPVNRTKYGEYGWVRLSDVEHSKLLTALGEDELARCIAYVDESAQGNGNKNGWKDWNVVIRKCSRGKWWLKASGSQYVKNDPAKKYIDTDGKW